MHLDQVAQPTVRLLRCEKLLRRSVVTLPNPKRQESGFVAYWWRIVAQGGPGTFDCCLRTMADLGPRQLPFQKLRGSYLIILYITSLYFGVRAY